jgi:hypothetical protein
MGKNIKYGEFTFPASSARPTERAASTEKSTKGIPKATYDAPHAMKKGGMCKSTEGYAKGGPKMPAKRESEAGVRREAALLRKPKSSETKMERKVGKVMGEFKAGDLHSGSKTGPVVKDRKQAIAIGMSEGRKAQGYKKGGSIEAKLEKHADMPAGKAHGPGAASKLAKGGVPTHSRVPKFGQMK